MHDIQKEATPNEDIAKFLSDLSEDVRNEKLDASQIQLVGEFYLNYLFNNDIRPSEPTTPDSSDCVDNNELIKFLSLGWYIYTFMVKDKTDTK